MDTMNNSMEPGGLRMRLHVRTRVPTKVTAFCLTVGSTVFEVEVENKDDIGC
jgi:hypothetical protein